MSQCELAEEVLICSNEISNQSTRVQVICRDFFSFLKKSLTASLKDVYSRFTVI